MATFSHRFGQEVNAVYRGKVEFTRAALNSTAIRLRSASWEDESCYICLFHIYPEGSKRRHTCLKVTGEPPVLHDQLSDHLHAFSCSATGKPAPSIHWELPPNAAVENQTETSTNRNPDGTVTSSRSVTLRAPPLWSGGVYCVLNQGTVHISFSLLLTVASSSLIIIIIIISGSWSSHQILASSLFNQT
uniref:CD80-like immunoglobulin C2-set domain-containing protein n=1 Tax=Oryzias latipes TaxID=8090 RepID=A0A3P9KH96_ORYLA